MKKCTKVMAFIIALTFVISSFTSVTTVLAAERKAKRDEKQWMQDAGAGLVDWAGQYKELDKDTVPEAVGYDHAKGKNHVERLYDEEGKNLNRVVFKNADGSRTQYIFDYPVKYKDKSGKVQDSTFEIADSSNGSYKFETKASASKTRFPKNIKDGIELSGNDAKIKLVPHDAKNDEPERIDEETISYTYDDNTTIEYSLTYTGFKEDIVVEEYTGQTEYEFTIYTEGLELAEIDGSYYLVDENDEIKATIGDIIIFTADEKNNTFGKLESETIIENQEYRMTIILDPEYLADPKTVYPIRIDPTVEISYDNNGAGAIQDVTINSLRGSSGSSGSLFVGLRQTYGISRTLMKFPGLNLSSLGSNVEITNATVELRDLMCEESYLTVYCYVFAGNEWTESTANWSNVDPNKSSTLLSSNSISYYNGVKLSTKHRYSFDITEAVKGWKTGNYNQNKGIIFKVASSIENGSTYNSRTIASYNRASNKPSLSVTYDNSPSSYHLLSDATYYLNNKDTGKYLKYSSSVASGTSGLLSSLGSSIQWEIRSAGNGEYVIRSKADKTKYLGVVSSSSSTVAIVLVSDETVPDRCKWTITMAGGSGYNIKNKANAKYLYSYGTSLYTSSTLGTSGTTTYNSRVWRVVNTASYGNTQSYSMRELASGFSVNNIIANVGEIVIPTINKGNQNVIWSSASDFTYAFSSGSSGIVTFNAVSAKATAIDVGIATIKAQHKVTNQVYTFKVYIDRYVWELVTSFGFSDSTAVLIRELYEKTDEKFPLETEAHKAWRCSRALGGITYGGKVYYGTAYGEIAWDDVAGKIQEADGAEYFIDTLGYTKTEYMQMKDEIVSQHSSDDVIDFSHMQISLASRLAYLLAKDGVLSNIIGSDEKISYLAGWLGDATLVEDNDTTSLKNDDYCADLDAENIFRLIKQKRSSVDSINSYYASLSSTNTRADVFLEYINYSTVEDKVFYELIDMYLYMGRDSAIGNTDSANYYSNLLNNKAYHWDEIRTKYPDTYNFLKSLQDGLANIDDYIE